MTSAKPFSTEELASLDEAIAGFCNVTREEALRLRATLAAKDLEIANEWARGYAVAMAEMHRSWHDTSCVREVLSRASITLGKLKALKLSDFDMKELRKVFR